MTTRLPGFSYDARKKVACFHPYVPGEKGRLRRKKTVFAATIEDAVEQWLAFRREISGTSVTPPIATFAGFVEESFEQIAARKSPRTRAQQRHVLRKKLLPYFGAQRLDEITSSKVSDFATAMRDDGASAAYVLVCVRILKSLLREAVERDAIAEYPLKKRIPLERPNQPELELSAEEQARFLAAFDDWDGFQRYLSEKQGAGKVSASPHFRTPRVFGGPRKPGGDAARYHFERFRASKPIFVLALETGLRKGDLLGLMKPAVDRRNRWIRVLTIKTKRESVVPISDACEEALTQLYELGRSCQYVCVTFDGQPAYETLLKRYFKIAKALAGITRRFRFHDLRHTFGSNLASEGVSLQAIQRSLGHSSIKMTERYARPNAEILREVRQALDRHMAGVTASLVVRPPIAATCLSRSSSDTPSNTTSSTNSC